MPGGDHRHIIDPPGVTVMHIAGGRYRVTAAHRVVWTWMNHFDPEAIFPNSNKENDPDLSLTQSSKIQPGDLVTMTIVDVFETDSDGKLLSYCPTFDNRSVSKTNPAVETIEKEFSRVVHTVNTMRQTKTGKQVEKTAYRMLNIAGNAAKTAAVNVGVAVKEQIKQRTHGGGHIRGNSDGVEAFQMAADADAIHHDAVAKIMSV